MCHLVWLQLLREVKALAKLSHIHIVGYNAAWMEYDSPSFQGQTVAEIEFAGCPVLGMENLNALAYGTL